MFDKVDPYRDQRVKHMSHKIMGAKCDGVLIYQGFKKGTHMIVIAHECAECGFFPLTIISGGITKIDGEDLFYED